MPSVTTSPWQAAVDRIDGKTVIGSKLRSADWALVPLALRERAFFSAGVENARVLSAMRDRVLQGLSQARVDGTLMNSARFVADMRQMLGAAPGDSDSLTDITSVRRLKLIWDFQDADAHAQAAYVASLDPDVQDAYPAQRLIRVESRRVPRQWLERWGTAGASVNWVGASRTEMVALITSPIWKALSRFGRPWPPFDYGSGMGLEAVDRDETEALGLLPKGEDPAARRQRLSGAIAEASRDWNAGLQASVSNLSTEARGWLKDAFGDQISIGRSNAVWVANPSPRVDPPAPVVSADAVPLPDVDRVTAAVAQADSREEAHAIVALPPAARGLLSLNPTPDATAQADAANTFLGSLMHKDVAPTATAKVELLAGRAYYDPNLATAFARRGDIATTIHELAHHIELSAPAILSECRDFLASRRKPGEKPRSLARLTGNYNYRPSEVAIEDDWARRGGSVYTGKVYGPTVESAMATEILTMGVERLYRDPVAFARDDPDYFKFILSVLRP